MIYITASAVIQKNRVFKLKKIYVVSDEKSYYIDFENKFSITPSVITVSDIKNIHLNSVTTNSPILYSDLRVLEGDAETSVKIISKQLSELTHLPNFDLVTFQTVSKYGQSALGIGK